MSGSVLLIEDNEQNAYLATYLLERAGYAVAGARDATRGIELARQHTPAIILLDIQLPGINGYQAAAALRRIEALDRVPIVAVTSYAMAGDREKALDAGCDGYIEKPIDAEGFIAQIAGYIAARR